MNELCDRRKIKLFLYPLFSPQINERRSDNSTNFLCQIKIQQHRDLSFLSSFHKNCIDRLKLLILQSNTRNDVWSRTRPRPTAMRIAHQNRYIRDTRVTRQIFTPSDAGARQVVSQLIQLRRNENMLTWKMFHSLSFNCW